VELSRCHLLWSQPRGADERSSLALDPSARQLYSLHEGCLKAYSLEGGQLWTAATATGAKLTAGPVLGPQGEIATRGPGGLVACFDPQGQLRWWVAGLPTSGGIDETPPVVAADGTVYALTYNPDYAGRQDPELRLRACRQGRVLWEQDLFSAGLSSPGMALGPDGTLYVAGVSPQTRSLLDRWLDEPVRCDLAVLAFSPDGKLRWASPVAPWDMYGGPSREVSLAVGPDGVVYASCVNGLPRLTAIGREGQKLWDFHLPRPYQEQAQIQGTPLVDEAGNLYLVCPARPWSTRAAVLSLDPGGKLRWIHPREEGRSGRPALVQDGRLWVEEEGGLSAYNCSSGELEVSWPLHPDPQARVRGLVAGPGGSHYVNVGGEILALPPLARITARPAREEVSAPPEVQVGSEESGEEWVDVGGVRLPRRPSGEAHP
jgi:outer membrane protein assembly factor BamB